MHGSWTCIFMFSRGPNQMAENRRPSQCTLFLGLSLANIPFLVPCSLFGEDEKNEIRGPPTPPPLPEGGGDRRS